MKVRLEYERDCHMEINWDRRRLGTKPTLTIASTNPIQMSSPQNPIPPHILIQSTRFPHPHAQITSLETPTVHYHFTPDDGPFDPSPYSSGNDRIIVWDLASNRASSLSNQLVVTGTRTDGFGQDAVSLLLVQEGQRPLDNLRDESVLVSSKLIPA